MQKHNLRSGQLGIYGSYAMSRMFCVSSPSYHTRDHHIPHEPDLEACPVYISTNEGFRLLKFIICSFNLASIDLRVSIVGNYASDRPIRSLVLSYFATSK